MDRKQLIQRLILIASAWAFVVIALGAFTRLTDAGLGCPDWPGCYGHLMPTQLHAIADHKAWAEMIHRYFAGSLGLLILAIVVLGYKYIRKFGTSTQLIPLFALAALLVYQPILGMWTVTWKLLPVIVSQHLLGGMAIFGLLTLLYLIFKQQPLRSSLLLNYQPNLLSGLLILGVILLYLQIALGAWTSTNYAAISCADFPFCQMAPWHLDFAHAFKLNAPVGLNYDGGLLSANAKKTIQMTHRVGALIVCLYWFSVAALVMFKSRDRRMLHTTFQLLGLIVLQISLGIGNVLLDRPLIIAVCHNLTAALILMNSIRIAYYSYKSASVSSKEEVRHVQRQPA